jgi:cytochrome c-type biogenesis protein
VGLVGWQLAKAVKAIVERGRPGDVLDEIIRRAGTPKDGLGFVSGHTAVAFALAAVLSLASNSGDPAKGALLAFVYALGIGLPLIAIAAGFNWATKSVGFVKLHIRKFNIAGGVVLMLLGILMVTGIWNLFASWLQAEVIGYFQLAI